MPYRLNVPTYDKPLGETGLWRFVNLNAGSTLVKTAGHWSVTTSPGTDELTAAQSYYRGGYQYTVSDIVAAELIADGFGAYVELI